MSYLNSNLTLKDIRFKAGKIELIFSDGRLLVAPLKYFPEIKKLNSLQRKKYHIIGGEGFDFDDSDEVYHINDFTGGLLIKDNQSMVNESVVDYKHSVKKKK